MQFIDQRLQRAAASWRWLKWFHATAILGAVGLAGVFSLGLLAWSGWIPTLLVAQILSGLLIASIMIAWAGVSLFLMFVSVDRRRLAESVESVHSGLEDRVNTLVHLEQTLPPSRASSLLVLQPQSEAALERVRQLETLRAYQERIRSQATQVLLGQPPRSTLSWFDLIWPVFLVLLMLLATMQFYRAVRPWDSLISRPDSAATAQKLDKPDLPILEVPSPEEQLIEPKEEWGEVRITEPGSDLRITRFDTVPLQIEAAASSPIEKVEWFTARNGGEETAHSLPPGTDPNYAAYREEIRAADAQLEDWDVLAYYAKARTQDGKEYQSDVHFLEVLPLRAELEELPGGDDGTTYKTLAELTALIERQQEVVRQTYRTPAPERNGESQRSPEPGGPDRNQLAQEEGELANGSRHLGAESTAELPQEVAQPFRDRLKQAEESLTNAHEGLPAASPADAQRLTRDALGKLTAARRFFQESVRRLPQPVAGDPETPPKDLDSQLAEIREYQNAHEAAREQLREIIQRERALQKQAQSTNPQEFDKLAKVQDQLSLNLEEFLREHPDWQEQMPQECQMARAICHSASQAFYGKHPQSAQIAGDAAEAMEHLEKTANEANAAQQLTQAYQMKQALDRQIGDLRKIESQPESVSAEQLKQEASETEKLVNELQRMAEQAPTRDQFQPQLREALSEATKQDLAKKCEGMCQSGSPGERGSAAAGVREGLEQIARAFESSQPHGSPRSGSGNPLQPEGEDALARGLRELESLAREAASQAGKGDSPSPRAASDSSGQSPQGQSLAQGNSPNRPATGSPPSSGQPSREGASPGTVPGESSDQPGTSAATRGQGLTPTQQQRLRQDALSHLRTGIYGRYGHNERSDQVVGELEQQLEDPDTAIDNRLVEQLMRKIQSIQREQRVVTEVESADTPDVMFIDPQKLPPTYRRPIESYFRRLSEQP